MLTGIINRRVGVRAPVQSEVKIDFRKANSEEIILAAATNLSAGGMQFTMPAQPQLLNIGEIINFLFQLPDYGEIAVQSEVRYRTIHPGTSGFEAHYGVKFLNFSLDNWNSIRQYCDLNQAAPLQETNLSNPLGEPDTALTAILKTTVELEDGVMINATIEDLSFGGVRLNLEQPLSVNSYVTLNMLYDQSILKLKGYCIWCAPERNTSRQFLAGVFFPHLEQDQFDQLKSLLNRNK